MAEAITRIRQVTGDISLDDFESSWEKRWLVERGLEIVSEASRRLDGDVKARHPHIPWSKVAGIGNVLRHNYHRVAADVLWKLVSCDLAPLEEAVRQELAEADRER